MGWVVGGDADYGHATGQRILEQFTENMVIRLDPERVLAESGKGFCREKDPKTSPAFMKLDRGSNEVAFADSIRSARREMK